MAERTDVSFASGDAACAAWLYRPPPPPPAATVTASACVVLAHGWTGVREQRLDAYAERFADAGLTALLFDYRHFGASGGEPRSLLDIRRQLEDWRAAVAFAREQTGVDGGRLALWGSSFSGGHVIETAARDPRIAAVVAQVPFVDGFANLLRLGPAHALRLTLEGVRDQAGALAGASPRMIRSVGPPGSVAVMNSPDAEPGFLALNPDGLDWPNEAAARVALRVGAYRPIRRASQVRCPILFALADADVITPPDIAERAAARAPRSEVRHYPGGHFGPYVGELFERVVRDQTEFLLRTLESAPRPAAPASAGSGRAA
jgi:pimeloyl-ACP methyl ester carboxylesterase